MQLRSGAQLSATGKRKQSEQADEPSRNPPLKRARPTHENTGKRKQSEQAYEPTRTPPLTRARLTHQNLKTHCKSLKASSDMPRKRKSNSGNSNTESQSSTTTTGPRFGDRLYANGVVYERWEAKAPRDVDDVRTYLDRDRMSSSPEPEDWEDYLEGVAESKNEATLQLTTWYKLAKPPPGKGYLCDANFEWTEVDASVTDRIGNAKPDITESYRLRRYPQQAVDELGPALAPTSYSIAMPTFAAEAKSIEKGSASAELQCAYDGAIMVDGARKTQEALGKSLDSFWITTQALTVAYNGNEMTILANHAVHTSAGVQHHSYSLHSHDPRQSLAEFKTSRKHLRNAQDWCRERATRTLEELRNYNRVTGPITPPQSDLTVRGSARRRLSQVEED